MYIVLICYASSGGHGPPHTIVTAKRKTISSYSSSFDFIFNFFCKGSRYISSFNTFNITSCFQSCDAKLNLNRFAQPQKSVCSFSMRLISWFMRCKKHSSNYCGITMPMTFPSNNGRMSESHVNSSCTACSSSHGILKKYLYLGEKTYEWVLCMG